MMMMMITDKHHPCVDFFPRETNPHERVSPIKKTPKIDERERNEERENLEGKKIKIKKIDRVQRELKKESVCVREKQKPKNPYFWFRSEQKRLRIFILHTYSLGQRDPPDLYQIRKFFFFFSIFCSLKSQSC